MSNQIFYTTERDKAQSLTNKPSFLIECDYNSDTRYQIDVWVKDVQVTDEEKSEDHLFDGGVFEHPVMFLRFGKQIIAYINEHYPNADIVIVDSVTEQGIRNGLDIQAKYDVQQLAGIKQF